MKKISIFIIMMISFGYSAIAQDVDRLKAKIDSLTLIKEKHAKEMNILNSRIAELREMVREAEDATIANSTTHTITTSAPSSLYTEASGTSKKVCILAGNTEVEILEAEGMFYKIVADGKTGYIYNYNVVDNEAVRRKKSEVKLNSGSSYQSTYSPTKTTSTKRSYRPSARRYIRGPRGGCYYINSSGNKQYVSRSLCN